MAILARNALEIIMVGTTHVVDLNGKSAFIYYETDERAHMRLPDGTTYHGQWELLDEGYRVEWTNGPAGTWNLDHQPGVIDYIDNTGAARGRVTRIDFSDTADLAA
jgi:hypothetical protein